MTDLQTSFDDARAAYREERARRLAQLEADLAPLRQAQHAAAADLVRAALRPIFAECADLVSISWTQHSHHWNDEDYYWDADIEYDALFLNDVYFYDAHEWRSTDGGYFSGGYFPLPAYRTLAPYYRDVADVLEGFQTDLEDMFGDFARVTITREGVTVEHYDYEG